MKNTILITFLFFCVNCIAQKEYITIENHTFEAFEGPNLARISKNFYADKTEITNSFYKEYLHWIKTAFGKKSNEYINALPKRHVWRFEESTNISYREYFKRVEFHDFPAVGITLDQAKKYSSWRTDRVAEMLLIQKGYLKASPNSLEKNNFTIEKYRNGEFELTKELDSILVFPRFSIPTIEEWDALSGISDDFKYGIDSSSVSNKTHLQASKVNKANHEFKTLPFKSCRSGLKNIYGLYHTIGNVSELVDEDGFAKGGDWKFDIKKIQPKRRIKQHLPSCNTGFRCVGRLEVL